MEIIGVCGIQFSGVRYFVEVLSDFSKIPFNCILCNECDQYQEIKIVYNGEGLIFRAMVQPWLFPNTAYPPFLKGLTSIVYLFSKSKELICKSERDYESLKIFMKENNVSIPIFHFLNDFWNKKANGGYVSLSEMKKKFPILAETRFGVSQSLTNTHDFHTIFKSVCN